MKEVISTAGLFIIGDEILSGRRNDKHFDYGVRYFSRLGVEVRWVCYIADDQELLVEHFRAINKKNDICFSFGGIGATPDDLTRQSMAEAHDLELVRHPEAVRLIEGRFGEGAYPNRIKMAELPKNSKLIPNDYNDIPGFSVGHIHCLPGFPEMARPMMDWVVRNRYVLPDKADCFYSSFIVRGIQESQLVPILEKLQAQEQKLKISSLPRFFAGGDRQIELGVSGRKEHAEVVIKKLKKELESQGFCDFSE